MGAPVHISLHVNRERAHVEYHPKLVDCNQSAEPHETLSEDVCLLLQRGPDWWEAQKSLSSCQSLECPQSNVRGGMTQPYVYESSCASPREKQNHICCHLLLTPKTISRLMAKLLRQQ